MLEVAFFAPLTFPHQVGITWLWTPALFWTVFPTTMGVFTSFFFVLLLFLEFSGRVGFF